MSVMQKKYRLAALAFAAVVALAGCSTEPSASVSPSPTATSASYATFKEAIAADDTAAVQAFIDEGEDVNQDFGLAITPLHVAASNDAGAVAALLIEAGAEVDARTKSGGATPLMLAAGSGGGGAVAALLDAGADPSLADGSGYKQGAIHYAAKADNVDALQVFLDRGYDLLQKDPGYSAPIIFAAFYGAPDAAFFLLDHGASLDEVDRVGQDVIQNAEAGGYPELADELRAYQDGAS